MWSFGARVETIDDGGQSLPYSVLLPHAEGGRVQYTFIIGPTEGQSDEALMNFQMDVTPSTPPAVSAAPSDGASDSVSLLRQILEVQRDQLAFLRAAHDVGSRWRAFVARWREDFPDLASSCREAMPYLERSYGALITELGEHLREQGSDGLDTDFSLQEFLDRYGMRLAQLGTVLNIVAPLAEAGGQGESA